MMSETYRGYLGSFRIEVEAGVLRGKVVNMRDTITFQGRTVPEVVAAFHDSVDDYLEFVPRGRWVARTTFRSCPGRDSDKRHGVGPTAPRVGTLSSASCGFAARTTSASCPGHPRHADAIAASPQLWMPWNYRDAEAS